jgi:hypothetical protein
LGDSAADGVVCAWSLLGSWQSRFANFIVFFRSFCRAAIRGRR